MIREMKNIKMVKIIVSAKKLCIYIYIYIYLSNYLKIHIPEKTIRQLIRVLKHKNYLFSMIKKNLTLNG